MAKLSVVIITKNEESNIVDAISSASFADEIYVVDNDSTDRTPELAEKEKATVIRGSYSDFSKQREEALGHIRSGWVFYLDADERISEKLQKEILIAVNNSEGKDVYRIKRKNFYFRKYEWPYIARIERLFKRESIKGWRGDIHESPVFEGKVGDLEGFLTHYTHNDLSSMLDKTIKWSDVEAKDRLDAKHPKMTWWRFPRVMATSFLSYYIRQKGYRLGTAGLIESMFQSFSTFITYAKLWEMQKGKK